MRRFDRSLILLREAWTVVIEALSWAELKEMNEDAALRKTCKQLKVKDRKVAVDASILLYEIMKKRNAVDYLIKTALDPQVFNVLELGLRNFLRLYTYVIHYGGYSHLEAHQLTDHARGILGIKKIESIEEVIDLIPHQEIPWEKLSREEALAYRSFLPNWYIKHIYRSFDEQTANELIQPIDTPKYIRLNTLKGDESSINKLNKQGFQFEPVPELKNTYRVIGDFTGLTDSAPYREGALILQDKASILVGEVASPEPNDIVLDVCAAPGIKTSHLAQIMRNQGRIISIDSDERRLTSWRRLIDKLGVTNAESILVDATSDYDISVKEVDIVLLDPPCSGTGTFNNIPSSKWSLTLKSIKDRVRIQNVLIEKTAKHLKKGGFLIYSTCSVTVEENEKVVKGFLGKHSEFRLIEPKPKLGTQGFLGLKETQRLYPSIHMCEGFFIAKLEKYQASI